jgi:hypothetical protein
LIYALQNLYEGKAEAARGMGDVHVHKIINFHFYNDLFHCQDARISTPMPSPCSRKVDESSFHIRPYELNPNSISDIKTFKPSYQLSFHRRMK